MVDIANALGTTVDSLLQDNIKASGDGIQKEIGALVGSLDDKGKQFILDMVKRYHYYHDIQ